MDLHEKFISFSTKNQLFEFSDSILIACSGGKDSMVLVDLMLRSNVKIALAYFDHDTRNGASATDGQFVMAFAKKFKIPFYTKRINIKNYIKAKSHFNSTNFQEVARDLRYKFLAEIADEHHYTYIATGHHSNDALESFIFNLSRASGPDGLIGILKKKNKIIRPLLFALDSEILEYIENNDLSHITDSSNVDLKYDRNRIRHKIIPQLELYKNNFVRSSNRTMQFIFEQNLFVKEQIKIWFEEHINFEDKQLKIPILELKNHHSPEFLLFQILKTKGFNRAQVRSILGASQKGKKIISHSHIAIIEANQIVAYENLAQQQSMKLSLDDFEISSTIPDSKSQFLPIKNSVQMEDLEIRRWKNGDFMMFKYGRKKLKKLFNEKDISNYDKHRFELIAKGSEVLWIFDLCKAQYESSNMKFLLFLK